MSQHAIEFLVEETVDVIDAADLAVETKRNLLAGIYKIQAFYDTGYTHFRVMDILLKYGFVQRVEAPAGTQPGWVDNDFAKAEDGKVFLYKDSECTLPVNDVFHQVIAETEQQGKQRLLTEWYGLLVNGYMEGIFEDGNILALAANDTLVAIRDIAQRNSVKRLRNSDEDVQMPVMKDEIEMAGDIDKEYVVRFFLDLKKPVDKLVVAYNKGSKAKQVGGNVLLELIDGEWGDALSGYGWIKATVEEENTWYWYRDDGGHRGFIKMIHEEGDKMLMCYIGMQHGTILKWQQREADTDMSHVHFTQMAIASLPEDRQESKHIHPYGGWKFDVKKSRSNLLTQLVYVLEDLHLATTNYFTFIHQEFPDAFFKHGAERLLDLLENGEGDMGIIPTYVLVDSPYSVLLLFAYHNHDEKMIDLIRERFNSKERKSAYETAIIEPFLQVGLKGPMPLVYHLLLAKELMKG